MLNFVKCFFCIYWDDYVTFVFSFVNVVYHIDLCMLKHPYDPGMNPMWSWCMILFMCCWISLANILLRIFASISSKILACIFVWFWYQGDGGFIEWYWGCSLPSILLEEFEKYWYKFFFVCLLELPSEANWSWTFIYKEFLYYRFYFTSSDRSVQTIYFFFF